MNFLPPKHHFPCLSVLSLFLFCRMKKVPLNERIIQELVDELALEVVFEAHREYKLAHSVCQICRSMYGAFAGW